MLSIIFILFFVKCNYCKVIDQGYYTETGREREGSASGDGKKTDFKTWLAGQQLYRNEDDVDASGKEDKEGSTSDHEVTDADCDEMHDIIFILDGSESIGPIGFRMIKSYTKQILNELDLSKCDNVGIIKFSDFAYTETYLGTQDTKTNMLARIDALEDPERLVATEVNKSRIALAMVVAEELAFTSQLGSRPKSKKYLVLMTDGKQPKHGSSNRSLTIESLVKKLTKKEIHILVLAIGQNPSIEELVRLTTEERNIFPERRLNDLMDVLVPKEKHANALNAMETDFYVTDEHKSEGENNFNFGN